MWFFSILSWAWNVKLQALTIEYLVVVESGRSLVETNVLTGEHLVIWSTTLGSPVSTRVFEVVLTFLVRFHYVFVSLHQRILNFSIILNTVSFLRIQYSHVRVILLKVSETISGRHEDAVGFGPLLLSSSECSGGDC